MNILITGANGFIGSYLCQHLADNNKVIGVDCSPENPALSALPNFKWHKADLTEGLSIADDVDVIVHTAARTPAPEVTTADYLSANITVTQKVIEFAIQKQAGLLVYLSAISVYGRIDSTIIDEDTPICDPTPYGMTKYFAELLLREKASSLPSVILRLPLVIGAGMKSGWLFKTYHTLRKGEPLSIYNGDSPYNMVHISDVYEFLLSILKYNAEGNNLFTVSCQDFLSVRKIVDIMKKHTGSPSEISEKSTGDIGFTISTEKARRLLDFLPKTAGEIVTGFLEEMNERG